MWVLFPKEETVEVANRLDKIMVATGMTDSVSEATRLIKGGGVSIRKSGPCFTSSKVVNPREVIPSGWPWIIRVSDGMWRIVRIPATQKFQMFRGMVEVMFPESNQTDMDIWL